MTPEEESKFTEKLTKQLSQQFIFIPKSRWYYILGGALAFCGVTVGSVMLYLHSEPAEIARKRIEQIRGEAETQLKELQAGDNYIHYGSQLALECERHPGLHLHAYSDQHVTVEKNALSSPFVRWTVRRLPAK